MSVLYLETSALLRYLFREKGAEEIVRELRAAGRVIGSRLLQLEARRAVLRLSIDQGSERGARAEHALESLWPRLDIHELTPDVCELAGRIAPEARLRSLDAIHLATFRILQRVHPGLRLLSCDERILGQAK